MHKICIHSLCSSVFGLQKSLLGNRIANTQCCLTVCKYWQPRE